MLASMPLTAELGLQSSHHTTSSDVFGDVLADVDVWAEFGTAHPPSYERVHEGIHEVVQEAITIAERIPSAAVVAKPPRTPNSRRRVMQAELLLRHPNSGRGLRRSSASETDLTQKSAQKHAQDPSSLPPMTRRTRVRKLGFLAVPPVPSLSEPPPPPPPRQLSVAEKRRQRNENISSRSHDCQFEEDDNTFPAFESDNNGSVDDTYPVDWKQQLGLFIQSRKSDIQAPNDRPVRRYSDGGMVFKVNHMFSEGGLNDVSDPNDISFDPVRPEADEAPDKPNEHHRRRQESRSEYLGDDRRRSSSNSAKNNKARRRGSRSAHQPSPTAETSSPRTKRSQDEEGKPPRRVSRSAHSPCPARSSSSKTQRSLEEDEDTDNLLSHLKHNLENEEESPRGVDMRSSLKKTLATPQRRGGVQTRQKSDSSELSHGSPKSRRDHSTSKRRESRRTSSPGNDPPPRESSVPRAGAKIKFAKRNPTNDDGTDAKSTRSDNKSTKSSKSSKSAKPSRSGSVKSSRRSSLGSCPPSPLPKSEKLTHSRSDDCPESPVVRRRSETAERRRSDAKELTPKVTGMPRRKIKFVRRGSNAGEERGHPPIPTRGV